MRKLLLAITLSCFIASPLFADTMILKDGERITGIITQEDENQIEFEMYYGAGKIIEKYSREEIEGVIKDWEENQNILKQYIEKLKEAEEQERMRREVEEEHNKTLEELDRKVQSEKNRKKKRRKEIEIRKRERTKKQKAAEAFNVSAGKLKASFKQKEIEDKAFRFGEITSYVRYEPPHGYVRFNSEYYKVYFQGLFYNEGSLTKKKVGVIMSFYDSEENLIARRSAYVIPIDIPPGEKGSFEISIRKSVPFATHEVSAVWGY